MSGPDLSGMDPQARRFLAMVAIGAGGTLRAPAEERRSSFEKLMRLSKPPTSPIETVDRVIPSVAGGITIRAYSSAEAPHILPGLVYFHGGGLVAGSLDTHDALCRTLADESNCRVLSVGYRLAPEHPFPAGVIDALVATRWICRYAAEVDVAADKIAIGGDSGGGTLAAIVCQVLHRRLAFKAQVLLCPVLDFAGAHPSRDTFADGFLLDQATMRRDLVDYAPRRNLADPRISPLRASSLIGLPHTLIHTAGFDPLRDEGNAFALALREAGVRVDFTCHETLIHHFYALTGPIPAARTALSAIAADIRCVLG